MVPARDALHHEARSVSLELPAQLLDGLLRLLEGDLFAGGGFGRGRKLHRLVQGMGDGFGSQRPIRGKKQRFDNTGQVHPTIFKNPQAKGKKRGENFWPSGKPGHLR